MTYFVTTKDGLINDGDTFGNTSPGVEGVDFPRLYGGDTMRIDQGHEVTVPGFKNVQLSIDFISGASGANLSKLILGYKSKLTIENNLDFKDFCKLEAAEGVTITSKTGAEKIRFMLPANSNAWASSISLTGTTSNPIILDVLFEKAVSGGSRYARAVNTATGRTSLIQGSISGTADFRMFGICRNEGGSLFAIDQPAVGTHFTASAATTPQYFDFTFTSGLTSLYMGFAAAGGTGRTFELDELFLEESTAPGVNVMSDGDMEATDFSAYSSLNSPTLTKESGLIGGTPGTNTITLTFANVTMSNPVTSATVEDVSFSGEYKMVDASFEIPSGYVSGGIPSIEASLKKQYSDYIATLPDMTTRGSIGLDFFGLIPSDCGTYRLAWDFTNKKLKILDSSMSELASGTDLTGVTFNATFLSK